MIFLLTFKLCKLKVWLLKTLTHVIPLKIPLAKLFIKGFFREFYCNEPCSTLCSLKAPQRSSYIAAHYPILMPPMQALPQRFTFNPDFQECINSFTFSTRERFREKMKTCFALASACLRCQPAADRDGAIS